MGRLPILAKDRQKTFKKNVIRRVPKKDRADVLLIYPIWVTAGGRGRAGGDQGQRSRAGKDLHDPAEIRSCEEQSYQTGTDRQPDNQPPMLSARRDQAAKA